MSCLILANWLHAVKAQRHPQNHKYITYSQLVSEEDRATAIGNTLKKMVKISLMVFD